MEPRLGVDVPSTPCITRCLPISGRHYALPRLDRVVQAVPSIDAKVRDEERATSLRPMAPPRSLAPCG